MERGQRERGSNQGCKRTTHKVDLSESWRKYDGGASSGEGGGGGLEAEEAGECLAKASASNRLQCGRTRLGR